MEDQITDNIMKSRYEMPVENDIAFIVYEKDDDVLYLVHTEVPKALRGRGIGYKLIENVLNYLKESKQKIVAECPTIKKYILSHKGYEFVIAD